MKRPIHPESVAGEPRAVRWVTDTGELPVGDVVAAPGTLGPLLEYGVLTRIALERGAVWTWLADELAWTEHGPRIRDAVAAAVELEGWGVSPDADDLLGLIAHDVVGSHLAGYIASHGGAITVTRVADGVVEVDFGGACTDCPAAGRTLHDRIERTIRDRFPALADVRRARH